MSKLYPITRVNEPKSRFIWRQLPIDGIVVRLQDLFSPVNLTWNKTFYDIQKVGGIHNFFSFDREIILSLVMRDKFIRFFKPYNYAQAINTLKPTAYTTPDGETYERGRDIILNGRGYSNENLSLSEINRCLQETRELLALCPLIIPIGQIKGSSPQQIAYHSNQLRQLGITNMMIHVSDFFKSGSPTMMARAKQYALIARKSCDKLYLFGMGTQKRLVEFSFADVYTTFGHYVRAHNGKIYVGQKLKEYRGISSLTAARHNLAMMIRNMQMMSYQKKLIEGGACTWEEDQLAVERITLQLEIQHTQTTQAVW